jgi:cephalosporin-C deacetylase-like acetyl esterase
MRFGRSRIRFGAALITTIHGGFLASLGLAAQLVITPGNGTGLYQPGQTVQWDLRAVNTNLSEISYVVKRGGLTEIARGSAKLSECKARIEAASGEPGWLLLETTFSDNGKADKSLGGSLVAPEKLTPNAPRPADFDSFWEAKLKEQASVPLQAQVTSNACDKPGVDYFKITMDNIRGTHIRGQLARPTQGDKFPAMLVVQWAGVYGFRKEWVTGPAAEGWLVLDINAHDLPIDESDQFYKDQSEGPLKDYPSIGNDDRETSYFLRMYLSCFRAAQYLTERPDWDGKTLIVTGGSQGGLQSFITASLHPKITAVLASLPAGCDLNGPEAGRMPGWPMWHWNTKGKDEAKVRNTATYYDVVNFASRVKCPVLAGVGLIDTVCPPPGIFIACNQLKGPKEIVTLPQGEHGEKDGSHRAYYQRFEAWKQALVKGRPAPVR